MPEDDVKRLMPLSNAEERSIVDFYRSFSEKDWELLKSTVAADWHAIPGGPNQKPGPDAFQPIFQQQISAFPDLAIAVQKVVGASGQAAVRAELKGTHRGEIQGVPPTGKPVCIAFHEFHEFRDGKIARTWYMGDWMSMLRQVGAWPPSA